MAECDRLSQAVKAAPAARYCWRKLAGAKWEDAWIERLKCYADRLAITALRSAKTIRLAVYALSEKEAKELAELFGGTSAVQTQGIALAPAKARPPIRVRGKLLVVSSEAERAAAIALGRPVLLIPAGMAFGTGEHATTATCLRLLADIAHELRSESWELLDLGCGTGILALAGRLLGAQRADAADFDPHAVRVAKENVRLNGVRGIFVKRLDVRGWAAPRTWPVVVANIYSGVLVEVASNITAAVAPGGRLIFSGILRAQEAEVLAAFRASGCAIGQLVRHGKWVTGRATRTVARGLARRKTR